MKKLIFTLIVVAGLSVSAHAWGPPDYIAGLTGDTKTIVISSQAVVQLCTPGATERTYFSFPSTFPYIVYLASASSLVNTSTSFSITITSGTQPLIFSPDGNNGSWVGPLFGRSITPVGVAGPSVGVYRAK